MVEVDAHDANLSGKILVKRSRMVDRIACAWAVPDSEA